MRETLIKIFYKPVLLQIAFWTAYYFFEIKHRPDFLNNEWIYFSAMAETLLYAAVVNINIFILLPKLFQSNRYLIYFISLFALMYVTAKTLNYLDVHLFISEIDIEAIKEFWGSRIEKGMSPMKVFPLMGLIFFSTLFTISRKKSKRETELHEQKISNELKMLKQQINPHFLFNAMNNIYTLSYLKSENTPKMILKLSEMMRYVLYECGDDKVSLEKEIEYIKNYISFQTLKSERNENVEFNFEDVAANHRVEPMLFIPFIENSFKHSKIEDIENSFIKMKMSSEECFLEFEIINSVPETESPKDKTSGIGLDNVKRRLELLYPGKHELVINRTDETFTVRLKIKLECECRLNAS